MKTKVYELTSLSNLRLHIHVVGYPNMGESILLFFCDGDKTDVIYSIVIDSFSYKTINKTFDLLDDYGINKQKLNLLCWSHPDKDHTFRMNDLLTNYCDDNTKVLYPHGIVSASYNILNNNQVDDVVFSLIKRLNNSKKLTKKPVGVDSGNIKTFSFNIGNDVKTYTVEINALSPFDSYIENFIDEKKKIHKNDLSIILQLVMPGGYSFLFCSDAEDTILQQLEDSRFCDPLFVKIPHHGSDTSLEIFKLLSTPKYNSIGCMTGFKAKGLPRHDVVSKYIDSKNPLLQRIDFTNQKRDKQDFGVISYEIDLYDGHRIKILHDGRAGKYK